MQSRDHMNIHAVASALQRATTTQIVLVTSAVHTAFIRKLRNLMHIISIAHSQQWSSHHIIRFRSHSENFKPAHL